MKNTNMFLLFLLVAISLLLVACSSSSSDGPRVISNGDSTNTDSGSNSANVDSTTEQGNSPAVSQDKQTELELCFSYVSKEKFKEILGEDIAFKSYSSSKKSCDFESVSESETRKNMVTIEHMKYSDKAWFLEQKQKTQEDTIYHSSYRSLTGIGDDAFSYFKMGWVRTRILDGEDVWSIESYIGSRTSIPELDNDYSDANQEIILDKKLKIAQAIAKEFKGN